MVETINISETMARYGYTSPAEVLTDISAAQAEGKEGLKSLAKARGFSISDLPIYLDYFNVWLSDEANFKSIEPDKVKALRNLVKELGIPGIDIVVSMKYPFIAKLISKDAPKVSKPQPIEEEYERPPPQADINYEVVELSKAGYSAKEIKEEIYQEYGKDLTLMQIGRLIKSSEPEPAPITTKQEKTHHGLMWWLWHYLGW